MSTLAWIGLGSNLGDRKAHLDAAVAGLGAHPEIILRAVSPYLETEPVGGPTHQPAYLNAAAALETTLDPSALLDVLQALEHQERRVRTVRWGERTLDLDLLVFGAEVIDSPRLTVPHLFLPLRRFVLAPLVEIAPDVVEPLTRRTIADLLANLDRRPSYVALSESVGEVVGPEARLAWFSRLVTALGATAWSAANWPPRSRDLSGDGWIVTDFWPDECTGRLGNRQPEGTDRSNTLAPTFVVIAGSAAAEPITEWPRRCHPGDPLGCDVPLLRVRRLARVPLPETTGDALLAEILAACAASRWDSWSPPTAGS